MNTAKMEKVFRDGKEYAFAKVRKIEGEYVVKVYIDGQYSEDDTYYTDDKEDAENTRTAMMNALSEKAEVEEQVEEQVERKEELNLTEKEEMVLRAIINESNFNFNHLDLTKDWEDQRLENPDSFWAFGDTKDYGCGLSKHACSGVFSSLDKKGFISIFNEDNTSWIVIDEKAFNKIKAVLR